MKAGRFSPGMASHRWLLLAMITGAFALRCAGLDTQELRGDEAFGYFFSLNAPWEIVEQTLELGEPHPVASYWVQHWWLAVAGHSEFALRFLGVCWSVMAVALMRPLVAALRMEPSSGLVAAAMLALSPYAIWHSQDARMYSMSLALTLASTLLVVRWWHIPDGKRAWPVAIAYVLGTWLALHTHYFALYIVAAHYLGLAGWAITQRSWHKLARWVGYGLVLLILWLPWLWVARKILLAYQGNGDSPGLFEAISRAFGAFIVGESVSGSDRMLWATLALSVLVLGAFVQRQRDQANKISSLWFLVVYALVPLAATWLSSQNRPIFNERYLVAAVPPVYLIMAAVVGRDVPRAASRSVRYAALQWGLVALVLAAMLYGLVAQRRDTDFSKSRGWRQLASTLELLADGAPPERVRLVQNYPDPTLWYYYQGDVPHLVLPPAAHDEARSFAEVDQLAGAGVERIVLVEQPAAAWDNSGIARAALQASYTPAAALSVQSWPVSIWLRPGTVLLPVEVAYDNALELRGALVTGENVRPGGLVTVFLEWFTPGGSVSEQETVSVQIWSGTGQLMAQSDRALKAAEVEPVPLAGYAILLPTALAPGRYDVVVVVYDPSLPGAPRRVTQGDVDHVRLGTIEVTSSE